MQTLKHVEIWLRSWNLFPVNLIQFLTCHYKFKSLGLFYTNHLIHMFLSQSTKQAYFNQHETRIQSETGSSQYRSTDFVPWGVEICQLQ